MSHLTREQLRAEREEREKRKALRDEQLESGRPAAGRSRFADDFPVGVKSRPALDDPDGDYLPPRTK